MQKKTFERKNYIIFIEVLGGSGYSARVGLKFINDEI